MADAETPTEIVLKMQEEGKSDAEIIAALTEEGLKPTQISEALNQARIKQAVEAKAKEKKARAKEAEEGLAPSILTARREELVEAEEVPRPSKEAEKVAKVAKGMPPEEVYPYEYAEGEAAPAIDTEAIEEIAEEIVNEKWEEAKAKISSVIEWKEYTESRLKSMDEKMQRIESVLDRLQAALLGEVKKYGQGVKDLGTEMQSLEGAFSKILSPLVTNIKELQRITGKLKPEESAKQQGKQKEKKK